MTTLEERVSRLEGGYQHLATKADIAHLATKDDIAHLENKFVGLQNDFANLKNDFSDLKSNFSNLKAEQAQSESRLLRWVVGLMGATAAAVVSSILVEVLTN